MKELLFGLADAVTKRLAGILGRPEWRRAKGRSPSGDPQFDADRVAEAEVREFLRAQRVDVALLTEDGELEVFGRRPEHVLIVDPIDGSRPASAGLESCCISIAAARYSRQARISDVEHALLQELRSGAVIYGDRAHNGLVSRGYPGPLPMLSSATDPRRMFWSIEFNGHPADLMIEAYGHLVDGSASRGGIFVFNSACFSISRIISGQLDAYVDIGNRLLRDRPELLPRFREAGAGSVLHLFPYDIAAAVFLAEKAGVTITDAYGDSLGETLLLDRSLDNQRSCIAASTAELHEKLLTGIRWPAASGNGRDRGREPAR